MCTNSEPRHYGAWDGPIRECTRCYSFHACVTFAVNQGTGVCGKQSTHSADLLMSCPAMKFWITLVAHPDKRIDPGPCGVMFQRLHMIAWSCIGQGWFQDHQGLLIHLKNSPIQLLKRRLQHGWRALACATAAERQSMQGLAQADVSFTLAAFQRLSPKEQGYMRYALNGSFYTNEKLIHSGIVNDKKCIWCEADDSGWHRHWQCQRHADLVAQLPDSLRACFQDLPPCTVNHAWLIEPTNLLPYWKLLSELPDKSRQCHPHWLSGCTHIHRWKQVVSQWHRTASSNMGVCCCGPTRWRFRQTCSRLCPRPYSNCFVCRDLGGYRSIWMGIGDFHTCNPLGW